MTHNQAILARLIALNALQKAKLPPPPNPAALAMSALREAIESKQSEIISMATTGKADTDAYRQAKSQLQRWQAAWQANR